MGSHGPRRMGPRRRDVRVRIGRRATRPSREGSRRHGRGRGPASRERNHETQHQHHPHRFGPDGRAAGAQAHDNPLNPGHKHGLEIPSDSGAAACFGPGPNWQVSVHFRESAKECPSWGCSYACLYRVWGEWEGGIDAGPPSYKKCHIQNSLNPGENTKAEFRVTKPSWVTGRWGVYVRDGWGQRDVTCPA